MDMICLLYTSVTEFDQAGRLEDEESTAAIGRIVRNGNGCAVRQFSEGFVLIGENGHWFKMNSTDGSKLQASGFAEFIQIWFVLEEV